MSKKKTDLFGFLREANRGNFSYIDRMSDDEVKGISAFVLLGWAMGADNSPEAHTIMTALYLGDKVFSLYRHPRLLLKLFVAANSDLGDTRYSYVKSTQGAVGATEEAIAWYYRCGVREAKDYAKILSEEDIKTIVGMHKEIKND